MRDLIERPAFSSPPTVDVS